MGRHWSGHLPSLRLQPVAGSDVIVMTVNLGKGDLYRLVSNDFIGIWDATLLHYE